MSEKHSPTPWRMIKNEGFKSCLHEYSYRLVDAKEYTICLNLDYYTANLIVSAVNSHEKLVEIAKNFKYAKKVWQDKINAINEALAKAGEAEADDAKTN
jgi:hypothetical protein